MRKFIASLLQSQAKRYIATTNAKVVAVTGSVGKTSTTQAIIAILSQELIVVGTLKNYNSDVGVPCSVFGRELPSQLKNPFAWLWVMLKNELTMLRPAKTDIFVLELGTDTPGEIAEFSWLQPDIAVVTAIAPEHMDQFKTIDVVAKEELSVAAYSDVVLINKTMVATEYLKYADSEAVFNYDRKDLSYFQLKPESLQVIGQHSIDSVVAGLKVGELLGMSQDNLKQGALEVRSQPGRMRVLKGVHDVTLIDDTYNSSPEAVIAALDYLYQTDAARKIALLGNMNELGKVSKQAHTDIGSYCDPKQLDLVVTLGTDANKYTAVAARNAGCKVVEVDSPYKAADTIALMLKKDAVILLKGSQNGVFAEEAVKKLLKNPSDQKYLVRQSKFWMKIKGKQFPGEY